MIAVHGNDAKPGLTLAALWERRGFLFTLTAGTMLLAGLLLVVIPPVYTGDALVALTVKGSDPFDHQTGTTAITPTVGQVQTEMEVMRSRDLASQVVEQLSLAGDPEFNHALRPVPGVLQFLQSGLQTIAKELPDWLTGPEKPAVDPRAKTVDVVMKGLTVTADAESYAIHVKFKAESAEKSARIANAFADIYVLGQLKNRFDDIERATDWVTKQITTLQGQVNAASGEAADFRERNHLTPLSLDPGLMASQQLVGLDTELGQAEQARADAQVKLSQAQGWLKNPQDLPPVDLVAQSPFIQSLRAQEAVVFARLAEMQAHYRDGHPAVTALKSQLDALRRDIAAEVEKVVQNLSAQLLQARSRESVLKQRMDSIAGNANKQSRPLTEMAQRQRDIDIKSGMLQTFMGRYNEIANRMEIEKPDARVVSRAMPATLPSFPQPLIFLGIALVGSLGLGASLVSMLERFRPGFFTAQQVKAELGLPTLGVVPEMRRLPGRVGPSDYMIEKPTSIYAEAIKSAQLAVLDARPLGETRRILIASSLPGEGKTGFAISLARSLATSGHRTLLLDCDFRRPAIGKHFGVKSGSPGLVDFLKQSAPIEQVLRHDGRTGLQFVAAGSRTEDPQKLLDSSLASTLLSGLMARFDMVIIDSPPTMVASDAAVLARSTDLVLYTVAWDRTPRGAVQAGIEYLQSHGANVAGVILSKVDFAKGGRNGDYVDYAFRYGNYYGT